jgi:hypothetical protein
MNKKFISANEMQQQSFELGLQIIESGFCPSHLLVVWRGGAAIGVTVHEVLDVCGITTEHMAVRVTSYAGIDQRKAQINIQDITAFSRELTPQHKLLIVDDVHDSGLSMQALLSKLKAHCGDQLPKQIKIATLYYKPDNSQVDFKPDYYLQKTADWLVFPHELQGLNGDELANDKPHIKNIRQQLLDKISG